MQFANLTILGCKLSDRAIKEPLESFSFFFLHLILMEQFGQFYRSHSLHLTLNLQAFSFHINRVKGFVNFQIDKKPGTKQLEH